MNEPHITFQTLRDRQLLWGIKALAVGSTVTVILSLLRAYTIGWSWVMGLHLSFYLVILVTALWGRRLSFAIRACILISAPLVVGLSGLLVWGLNSMGFMSLFVASMLVTVLFGTHKGIAAAVLCVIGAGMIGLLYGAGILTIRYNPHIFLTSYFTWGTAVVGLAVALVLTAITLGSAHEEIDKLLVMVQMQNQELAKALSQLKEEIAERNRVELAQQELECRFRKAEALEMIGTMAAGVAHDLNNVLVGSVTLPDMILMQLPEGNPLRKQITLIRQSGLKAAAMVQDLLTLARRGVKPSEAVNLNAIIEEYAASPEFEKLKAYHPQMAVEIRLDPDLPNIKGSVIHLDKILMNLVSNAAEAMPDGGTLVISTRAVREGRAAVLDQLGPGNDALLSVADTGIGIAEEDLQKIFEPFFTKKILGRSGTGLGMAVVWASVSDHGGHIDVQSEIGKGTVITVCFPSTEEAVRKQPKRELLESYIGRGESILIVDDVKEQREITAAMLQQLGYSVHVAASGEEALRRLEEATPDLLILDMHMEPGMDGLATYRKALERFPRQKAIIASGYAESWRVKAAQRLGAGAYIRKPFVLSDIALAIRFELDRGRLGMGSRS